MLAAGLVLLHCGTVPARIERDAGVRQNEQLRLFVVAQYQRQRVLRALEDAGLETVKRLSETRYVLRVDLGIAKDSKACGTLNNVRFVVLADGVILLEVVARGWTEVCEPNVFDEMSRLLASRLLVR